MTSGTTKVRHCKYQSLFGSLALLLAVLTTLLFPAILLVAQSNSPANLKPTVILISIDGFRFDYPEKAETPNLHSVIASGVRADGLIPQFPTLTFPNHYAIVTGLLPAHNGIVANTMYDPALHALFKMTDHAQVTDSRWWGGEPIWVTAEKQGQKAATMFWPGSEAEIEGIHPTYWLPYDKEKSNAERVKQVLDWLDLPASQRPTLLTLYFDEVDHAGHDHGPNSTEVNNAIRDVDTAIGLLMRGLSDRGIENRINIVIVSDHGMVETSCTRVIDLRPKLSGEHVIVGESGALLTLYPTGTDVNSLFEKLAHIPHLTLYRSSETPLRWTYRDSPRIAPIIGVADAGWSIVTQNPSSAEAKRGCIGGKHGYDNYDPELQGIFIAHGPAFTRGARIRPFDNVDIYSLLAYLLGIQGHSNDGSIAPFRGVLQEHKCQARL